MESNYKKVAIIGAGIIGLYLGWKLKEKGHQVTIFEQKPNIWLKPCSGLISERLQNFIPLPESVIENKIDYCLIHFPRKTITLKFKPPHLVINRQKLNEYLAKISGVEIRFNQEISQIPQDFDRVIGCDGALSQVRRGLGLPDPKFRFASQNFESAEARPPQVEVWPRKNGFSWKIPRGERAEYGALGSEKGVPVPQGLVLPKLKNVTLCGDAAGLCKPWSGGGVIWGLTAADILLKHFPDFEKYHKETKRFFLPKIWKGKLATVLTYFLGNNFPYLLPSKITRDNDFPLLF